MCKIENIKQQLLTDFNIKSDRDLIKQLGIKEEDKKKLFLWIEYQCQYSYEEGYTNGQEALKISLKELSDKKKELLKLRNF